MRPEVLKELLKTPEVKEAIKEIVRELLVEELKVSLRVENEREDDSFFTNTSVELSLTNGVGIEPTYIGSDSAYVRTS